jgi:hypothetical protein
MRFNYKHSILKENVTNNDVKLGQRLSVMLRVECLFDLTPKFQQISASLQELPRTESL